MPANFQQQTLISGVIQLVNGFLYFVLGMVELFMTRRTISSLLGTPIWAGFWILATGIIGVLAVRGRNCCGSFRCMAAVYLGFCITSIVLACMMITTCSLTLVWYGYAINRKEFVTVSVLLLVISIVELGAAIWGVICSCATVRCCGDQQTSAGQVMYMQTQGGGASVAYVIVQGSDGTPVAVPAQPAGPMVASGGTPVINQGGAVTTTVPPYYQQQPQSQSGVPVAVTTQSGGTMMARGGTPQGGVTTLHYQTPMQQQQQLQNDPVKVAL